MNVDYTKSKIFKQLKDTFPALGEKDTIVLAEKILRKIYKKNSEFIKDWTNKIKNL